MKVTVCMGSKCVLMGNMNILNQIEELKETIPNLEIDIETVKCLGYCKQDENVSPIVKIDNEVIKRATSHEVMEILTKNLDKEV